jgi:hypothetical protein
MNLFLAGKHDPAARECPMLLKLQQHPMNLPFISWCGFEYFVFFCTKFQ